MWGGILAGACRQKAVQPAWTPASLPGLALWLETKDGAFWQDVARTTPAVADGDVVKAWDDQSGNANHATDATGATLKTGIAGVGGEKVVRFDGVNDVLALAFGATVVQPITVLAVYDQGRPLDKAGGGARCLLNPTIGTFGMWAGVALESAETTTPGTFRLVVAQFDGADSRLFVDDGENPTEGDAGTNNCDGVRLFSDGGSYFAGDCAALIVCDALLTDAQVNLGAAYLASRYGLTWTPIPGAEPPVTTGPWWSAYGPWHPEV